MIAPDIRSRMKKIRDTIENGGRLNMDDGIFMYSPEVSLHELGELANFR